jgi:hypothetical protein
MYFFFSRWCIFFFIFFRVSFYFIFCIYYTHHSYTFFPFCFIQTLSFFSIYPSHIVSTATAITITENSYTIPLSFFLFHFYINIFIPSRKKNIPAHSISTPSQDRHKKLQFRQPNGTLEKILSSGNRHGGRHRTPFQLVGIE